MWMHTSKSFYSFFLLKTASSIQRCTYSAMSTSAKACTGCQGLAYSDRGPTQIGGRHNGSNGSDDVQRFSLSSPVKIKR